MKKKNRLLKWLVLILILLLAAGGILKLFEKNSTKTVDVYSVNDIKVDGVMENVSLSGMITDHASQEVMEDEDRAVKEILVNNGQRVKKGDPLLCYDMTLKELELKDAKIHLQLEEENIKRIKRQMNNPQKYILDNYGSVLDSLTDTDDDVDSNEESEEEIQTMEQTPEAQKDSSNEEPMKGDELTTMDAAPGGIEVPEDPEDPQGDTNSVKVTKEEIKEYVEGKQMELKQAELSLQKKKLQVSKLEKEAEKSITKSYLDGVVKINDNNDGDDGVVLTVESTNGLYIEGAMSEYLVQKVKAGDLLSGEDYYTGAVFEAEVQSVSDTPKTEGGMYDYSGMGNMSYYGFTAEIQGEIEAESGDDCSLKIMGNENEDGIYIEKMFVRQDNSGSYVYKENKKGKLEKTRVNVGAIIDGYYVKILDGLEESDHVAFPYGKSVKDGAKTNQTGIDSLYQ